MQTADRRLTEFAKEYLSGNKKHRCTAQEMLIRIIRKSLR
jgi:hypothetical protein